MTSVRSITSIGDVGSVGSFGSVGSVTSVRSLRSVASIGSVTSVRSVGSFGSVRSVVTGYSVTAESRAWQVTGTGRHCQGRLRSQQEIRTQRFSIEDSRICPTCCLVNVK